MKVVVAGGFGQVGSAVYDRGRARGVDVTCLAREQLDITNSAAIHKRLGVEKPDAVINCAAYTAVDKAEAERDRAFAINAIGASTLAALCNVANIPLIHVSTDYVFDGTASRPYREDDPLAPLGVYGESKAAGEAGVRDAHPGAIIVRTSWVFSRRHECFVRTMERLAIGRPQLRVVDDQLGCPTFADDLADVLLELAVRAVRGDDLDGVYHACNEGAVTWCGFARAIVGVVDARMHGKIACKEVVAITTADYPTAAKRPAYSVLDTSRLRAIGITLPSWQSVLPEAIS